MLSAHEKLRHADSRRVHRVLLSKLDVGPTSEEDATDEEKKGLGGRVMGLVSRTSVGVGGIISPIADLGSLIRIVLSGRDRNREREKDRGSRDTESWKEHMDVMDEKEKVAGSVRALWGGKVEALVRMRERAEGKWARLVRNERERERDANWKDKDRPTLSDIEDPAVKSNGEDELAFGGAWSGKVQKKLEMWAGLVNCSFVISFVHLVGVQDKPVEALGRLAWTREVLGSCVVRCDPIVCTIFLIRTRLPCV